MSVVPLDRAMAEWSAGVARKPHCRNCDAFAPDQFCSVCGQETQIALPTVRQIMRDAGGSLVAIDGRLWRTLQALLFRPGLLTLEYLRGRRKHYIRPARLFFITALLLFAVMRLVDSPSMVIDSPVGTGSTANAPDTKAAAAGGVPGAGKAHADTEAIQDDIDVQRAIAAMSAKLPSGLRNNLEHFVRLSPQDGAKQVYGAVLRFGPYAMVMLLPVFALLLWLSYLPQRLSPTRRRRYAEHLVYGAHLHAFAFLTISAIILSPLAVVRYALAVWIVVYVWRARRKIDGGSRLASFARVVFVAAVYVVLLGFTMTALIALAMVL